MTIDRMLRILEKKRGTGWHLDVGDPALARLLGNLLDPVTLCVPREPVVMPDGSLYDKKTLERLRDGDTIVSPVTRQEMRPAETGGAFEEKMVTAVLCLVLDHFRLS